MSRLNLPIAAYLLGMAIGPIAFFTTAEPTVQGTLVAGAQTIGYAIAYTVISAWLIVVVRPELHDVFGTEAKS
jgi:hypothetical protein